MNDGSPIAIQFRKRFYAAQSTSGISLSELARLSQNSASKLQSIAKGEFDHSKDGPGIFGMHRATAQLGVTLDDLAPPVEIRRPGINRFLSCYMAKDLPISNFATVLEFCDVYHEPRDGLSRLKRLGAKSLLVCASNIDDPEIIQLEYESWPASRRKRIFDRQMQAWVNGYVTDSEICDATFSKPNRRARMSLILAACRVTDLDGETVLLVYAEPLGQQS